MTVKENIENIYQTFAQYTVNRKMEKCPCGCISDGEEQMVYSKSLRDLEVEDIGFYSGKAMTTWGNEENYKHFLPRIVEIYIRDRTNCYIDLDTIYGKLKYANWNEWDELERSCILEFVKLDWNEFVNKSENQISIHDIQSYQNYFDWDSLFGEWEFPENKLALRNFVDFFYRNGNEIMGNVNVDREEKDIDLYRLINRESLTVSLEKEFFDNEINDKEYAYIVSIVLGMIENELNK